MMRRMGLKLSNPRLQPQSGWWPDDTAMAMDLISGQGMKAGAAAPLSSLITCSRVSDGTAQMLDGTWREFSANELRRTDRGLLIEKSRTNICPYSEHDPQWAGYGSTPPAVQNDVTVEGRRGVSVTFTGTSDTGYGGSRATHQSRNFGYLTNTPYSTSYDIRFSRPLTGSESVYVYLTGAWGGFGRYFNSGNTATEWVRQKISATTPSSGNYLYFTVYLYNAVSSDVTVYLARRQFEIGAAASSYIKTDGSTVTREADDIRFAGLTWLQADSGTLLMEFAPVQPSAGDTPRLISFSDGTGDNAIETYFDSNGDLHMRVADGGIEQVLQSAGPLAFGAGNKAAIAWESGNFGISLNGSAAVTNTAGTVPLGLNQSQLGGRYPAAEFMSGWVRKVLYWPNRKSNSELQSLTTI